MLRTKIDLKLRTKVKTEKTRFFPYDEKSASNNEKPKCNRANNRRNIDQGMQRYLVNEVLTNGLWY